MSHIDKEYNRRFKNQQLAKDDFDSDGLWDAISKKMVDDTSNPTSFFYSKKWMLGLLCLLITGGVIGLLFIESDNKHIVQSDSTQTINDKINSNQNKENSFSSINKKEEQQNPQIANVKDVKDAKTTTSTFQNKKSAKHFQTKNKKQNIFHQKNISSNSLEKNNAIEKFAIAQTVVINEKQDSQASNKESKIATSLPSTIDNPISEQLFFPPTKMALAKSNKPTLIAVNLLKVKTWNPKKTNSIVWNIGVMSGGNTTDFKYKSESNLDLANLKNTTEKKGFGTSYGIQTGVLLNNHWLLNSGIEYHQLWSKLEYEQKKDIQILKENQLLKVWLDQATGDTLQKLYNDTIINAIAYRDILHHNKYRKISIPIEIGAQQYFNKFIYGITAGAVFNFTTIQSGKTIDNEQEVVDFEKNDSTAPLKSFDIGFRISPFIGYQLSEQWAMSLHPQWNWQGNNQFDGTDLKVNLHQFNLNIGLKYSFH